MATGLKVATLMAFEGQIKVRLEAVPFEDVRSAVDAMKASIPRSSLRWNPARTKERQPIKGGDNTWIVGPAHMERLSSVLEGCGFEVVSMGGAESVIDTRDPYRIMFGGVSDMHLKKLHVALAKAYHPDRGGDAKVMKGINEGWQTIKMERGL